MNQPSCAGDDFTCFCTTPVYNTTKRNEKAWQLFKWYIVKQLYKWQKKEIEQKQQFLIKQLENLTQLSYLVILYIICFFKIISSLSSIHFDKNNNLSLVTCHNKNRATHSNS